MLSKCSFVFSSHTRVDGTGAKNVKVWSKESGAHAPYSLMHHLNIWDLVYPAVLGKLSPFPFLVSNSMCQLNCSWSHSNSSKMLGYLLWYFILLLLINLTHSRNSIGNYATIKHGHIYDSYQLIIDIPSSYL